MEPIGIKIKKEPAKQNGEPTIRFFAPQIIKKNFNKRVFWLPISSILILVGTLAVFLFLKPALPYANLIPSRVPVFYFNQGDMANLTGVLVKNNYAWPPFIWLKDSWQKLLADNKLEIKQISPLFKESMALVWPQSSASGPVWLLLAMKQASDNAFGTALEQMEKQLEQNYNLVLDTYRQIKIIGIKALAKNQPDIFYAQIKNYFLISNNSDFLKETLNKAIGR